MANRSSNNWKIHSNWTEDGKRMHLVGLLEGKPYEVIGGEAEQIEIPRKYREGQLTKRSYKTANSNCSSVSCVVCICKHTYNVFNCQRIFVFTHT